MHSDEAAQVRSIEALEAFVEALARFGDKGPELVRGIQRRIEARRRDAERKVEECESQLEQAHQSVRRAPDEDDGYEEDTEAVEAAEAAVQQARRTLDRVESLARAAEVELGTLHQTFADAGPAAQFITRKAELLRANARIQLADSFVNTGTTGGGMMSPKATASPLQSAAACEVALAPNSYAGCPLPEGFVWVPIEEIAVAQELAGVASPADFKKVEYATMRRGFELLQAEVLPVIAAHPERTWWNHYEYFTRLDAERGQPVEEGYQRAFEALFSQSDAIYLSRGRDEAQYRVISGRHRIKVALDAGWKTIPTRTKDLRV